MMTKSPGTMQMVPVTCTQVKFKTIKGKKYAFRNDGRMLTGLKFIKEGDEDFADVKADDDDSRPIR